MTTCEARYQVCCSVCGSVDFEPSRSEAHGTANRHAGRCDGAITVFDRMARKRCTNFWRLERGWGGYQILKSAGMRETA